MKPKLAAVLLALTTAIIVTGLGLERGWWRANHPDPIRYPLWGVDVSHHQHAIDWPLLKAREPRLAFAYVKATEGTDWTDPQLRENWAHARGAGFRVGAYHFFTFCKPGADQAKHFLATLPVDEDSLPPALDLEMGGNCKQRPDDEAIRRELRTWLSIVESALGRRPVIYVTGEAYDAFLRRADFHPLIWIRDVWTEPRLEPGDSFVLWQFASRGRLDGVDTFIDLNVFDGSREELERL